MKRAVLLAALLVCAANARPESAKPLPWPAVDGLGRSLSDDVRISRGDKFVGVFYYIWHGAHGYDGSNDAGMDADQGPQAKTASSYKSPYVIPEILKHPAESRLWGPPGAFHHWGESRWGFYLPDDEWVIRKNAQLLADAGVDVIFFDVTNGFTYRHTYLEICRVYTAMRKEGNPTPQIAFLAWNGDQAAPQVYEDFYKKGLYKELWFQWKGKPLILCKSSQLTPEMKAFFTHRESWAWTDPGQWFGNGQDKWPWLASTPQNFGWHESADKPEQVAVATAEHPNSNKGKSFHDGKQPPPAEQHTERGLYFAEQWKRALQINPEFIFITQWNEWMAQRFIADGPMNFAGGKIAKGDSYFVDLYTMEYNRDIEPMRGGYSDNYYYQMVDGIRRFKGLPRFPTTEYRDDRGDIFHRNHAGYGSAGPYINETGRNDIISAHVQCDDALVRISATTANPLSPSTDANWMMLFIRTDAGQPGWEGFQFVINRQPPKDGKALLERLGTGVHLEPIPLDMQLEERRVTIAIPRRFLERKIGAPLEFGFKWADNMQKLDDATDWMVSGDAAPNSRFVYTFREADQVLSK